MTVQDTEPHLLTKTPSASRRWRFGNLSRAELLPKLQQYLMTHHRAQQWQVVWLDNAGQPVIGLLPKVSWSVYPSAERSAPNETRCRIVKYDRADHQLANDEMSYADWQQALIAYSEQQQTQQQDPEPQTSVDPTDTSPSYHHGLIGFIGYDIAAQTLSPAADIQQAAQPSAILGHYDIYLKTNGDDQHWTLHVVAGADPNLPCQTRAIHTVINALDQLAHQISEPQYQPTNLLSPLTMRPRWQKKDYEQAFAATRDYLIQGDCYQINLTQVWQGTLHQQNASHQATNLADYLPALQRNTGAPFAGYLGFCDVQQHDLQQSGLQQAVPKNVPPTQLSFELLSCSPELFFTFIKDQTGRHHIRTKPIKGTQPRGDTIEQDIALKQQLIDSDKDRSENVMIVDLLRNDLGKYAKVGSVKVPQLFAIESFSNVHHMVSTITAELKADTHPLAVLFGSLPAGSITGTPKKRAVEIISELEVMPRGAYCGTMGYINFDGSGQWNVLIRTLQAQLVDPKHKQVSLWAGGGITIASDCDAEYQECLDKVGNLLGVLAQPQSVNRSP